MAEDDVSGQSPSGSASSPPLFWGSPLPPSPGASVAPDPPAAVREVEDLFAAPPPEPPPFPAVPEIADLFADPPPEEPPFPAEPSSVPRWRRHKKIAATLALFLLFSGLASVRLGLSLARRDVLAESTYSDALYNADVYNRVYTDVAGAPELSQGGFPLLGHGDPSYAIAQLRLLYPPDKLETTVEAMLHEFFLYIHGQDTKLGASFDARPMIDFALEQLQGIADIIGQRLGVVNVGTPAQFAATIGAFSDDLQAGHLPFKLPSVKVPIEVAGLVANSLMDALSVPADSLVRAELTNELSAGRTTAATVDILGAYSAKFLAASPGSAAPAATTADLAAQLTALGNGLVNGAKTEVDRGPPIPVKVKAVPTLNLLRRIVIGLSPWTQAVADLAALMCLAFLVRPYWRRPRQLLRAVGVVLMLTGALVGGLFLLVLKVVPHHLVTQFTSGSNLPPNLQVLIDDVVWWIIKRMQSSVAYEALICMGVGLGLVGLTFAHKLFELAVAEGRRLEHRIAHVAVVVGSAAAVAALGILVVAPAVSGAVAGAQPCNGHADLCSRAYDDVVYPGSHNSMSNADEGFVNPDQDWQITDQLDLGIRALFIDTHYWENLSDRVGTAARLPPELQGDVAAAVAKGLPPRPGIWLCHNLCSLGALDFTEELRLINGWLDKHPREVLTLFIQDEVNHENPATGNRDTEQAFKNSGLISRVWTYDPAEGWPTLKEMIDSQRNVVVLSEFSKPPPAWYTAGFSVAMETPFSSKTVEQFNCLPNRGGEHKTLFTLSNWLDKTAPSRSDAAIVNDIDFIINRAEQCTTARGHVPTFLAVNFANIGDVVGAADYLNGF